jgi:hypothetical protein
MSCSCSVSKQKFDSGDLEITRYVQFQFNKVRHLSPSLQFLYLYPSQNPPYFVQELMKSSSKDFPERKKKQELHS